MKNIPQVVFKRIIKIKLNYKLKILTKVKFQNKNPKKIKRRKLFIVRGIKIRNYTHNLQVQDRYPNYTRGYEYGAALLHCLRSQ